MFKNLLKEIRLTVKLSNNHNKEVNHNNTMITSIPYRYINTFGKITKANQIQYEIPEIEFPGFHANGAKVTSENDQKLCQVQLWKKFYNRTFLKYIACLHQDFILPTVAATDCF